MSEIHPKTLDLYAYYGIERGHTRPTIGSYVCNIPMHVTFGKFQTSQPQLVLEGLRESLIDQPELPHMTRDRLALSERSSRGRRKPIVLLHDAAERLMRVQDDAMRAVQRQPAHTRIYGWPRFTATRRPHVTVDQAERDPYFPQEFDIDHIIVSSGVRVGAQHWHNYIWDIIPLQ